MELVSFNSKKFHFLAFSRPGKPPGSDFGSHLPTKGTFGPQKVTNK
jgi:hypothetical protein